MAISLGFLQDGLGSNREHKCNTVIRLGNFREKTNRSSLHYSFNFSIALKFFKKSKLEKGNLCATAPVFTLHLVIDHSSLICSKSRHLILLGTWFSFSTLKSAAQKSNALYSTSLLSYLGYCHYDSHSSNLVCPSPSLDPTHTSPSQSSCCWAHLLPCALCMGIERSFENTNYLCCFAHTICQRSPPTAFKTETPSVAGQGPCRPHLSHHFCFSAPNTCAVAG